MEQLKFIFGNLINIPLFPILFYQAKQIRKSIPELPEAQKPSGIAGTGLPKIKVLCIGESTIAGVGVAIHEEGYTGQLSKTLAELLEATINWQVIAKSGYTAQMVNKELIPKIENTATDIIIIGLGGNDTFKMTSPIRWKIDIESLIDQLHLKFPNSPIVFTNVPPIRDFPAFTPIIKFVLGKQIDLLHHVLKKAVRQRQNVWYIENRIQLKDWLNHFEKEKYSEKDFFSDGVHPSRLTYKVWGEETAKFIFENKILS